MTSVNYYRVLLKAECKDCQWKGYDVDCENADFWLISEFKNENGSGVTYEVNMKHECPVCKSNNIEIENFNQQIQ